MYFCRILTVLVFMIVVTGAAHSVIVKFFYQFGFKKPFFVTLLYLLGQAISLLVYAAFTLKSGKQRYVQEEDEDPEMEEGQNDKSQSALAISYFAHITDG